MGYLELSKQELEKEYGNLVKRFEEFKGMGLNLNMARGKPSKEQLDFSLPMLDTINSKSDFIGEDKMDCRNYGLLNGITECRKLFADILGVDAENVIVGGSSSLNMMFDTISCFMTAPAVEGCKPWYEVKNRKFLCPVPGYARHFGVTEYFGVEMINVPIRNLKPRPEKLFFILFSSIFFSLPHVIEKAVHHKDTQPLIFLLRSIPQDHSLQLLPKSSALLPHPRLRIRIQSHLRT